jgi:radical SAM protein (TIGR01212 family)
MEPPFTEYSRYLARRYGEKTYRVSVDAGFDCPHRRGAEAAGCAFCSRDRARAPYLRSAGDLRDQVEKGTRFLSARYGARFFLLYFQASCGTNAPPEELRRIYDSALRAAPFRGLIVGTRPDCIDDGKAALLASYIAPGFDVWVELGLQSARDETLRLINRGHSAADFERGYGACRRRGLKVAVHLIFGLPGESSADMAETVRFVAGLRPDGVKLHNLHIPASSGLAADYPKGEVTAPGPERYLEYVISALELLPEQTVIVRLTTDTPDADLLSPRFFWDKRTFASRLAGEMTRRGTRQGRLDEARANLDRADSMG